MENNRSLLHAFDLAKAKAGEAICWSNLHIPCSFVGEASCGKVAMKNEAGFIEIVDTSSLRMKPLFWKDSKPVYKGDKLWHKIARKFITVDCLQDEIGAETQGFFIDTKGIKVMAELCFWDEPKPKPKPAPLFQHEGKDVFRGDCLWNHLYKCYVTVDRMQDTPMSDGAYFFIATDGSFCCAAFCSWEKPSGVLDTHDGLPVYVGSTLWHDCDNCWVKIVAVLPNKDFLDDAGKNHSPCYLHWDKPVPSKTTQVRYTNVYYDNGEATLGATHFTKELAEKSAPHGSRGVARVEWQE